MQRYGALNASPRVSKPSKKLVLPGKNKVDLSKNTMGETLKKRHTMSYNA